MVQPLAGSGFTGSSVNFDFHGEPAGPNLGLPIGTNPPRGIIFFDTDAMMLKRTDGVGGAAAIGGGAGGPSGLQMEYDTGQMINENSTNLPLSITKTVVSSFNLFEVIYTPSASAIGDALSVTMGANAAGQGLSITHLGTSHSSAMNITTTGGGLGLRIEMQSTANPQSCISLEQDSEVAGGSGMEVLCSSTSNIDKCLILTHNGTGAVAGENVCFRLEGAVQSVGIELDSGASLPVGVAGEGRIRYLPGVGVEHSSEGAAYRTFASRVAAADYTLSNTGTASRAIDRNTFTINDLFDFVHAMVVDLAAADVFDALVVT